MIALYSTRFLRAQYSYFSQMSTPRNIIFAYVVDDMQHFLRSNSLNVVSIALKAGKDEKLTESQGLLTRDFPSSVISSADYREQHPSCPRTYDTLAPSPVGAEPSLVISTLVHVIRSFEVFNAEITLSGNFF